MTRLRPAVEQFTREVATHNATCDGTLTVAEYTIRPLQDGTVALSCATCGAIFRARFTVADDTDPAEIERLFDSVVRHVIN